MSITKEEITGVKARGFLLNKGTECFSGRVVSVAGCFSPDELRALAACAETYGNGRVLFTSRLSAEVVGIPYDKIPEAEAFMAKHGLSFGGTGAKVRPITACKGTTCIFGIIDTQALARVIHERFYIGMADVKLPHKFKISVGGCPHSCMKPSLNDVGIEGGRMLDPVTKEGRSVCRIYVGGTWGKTKRMGTLLDTVCTEAEAPDIIEKVMLWYKENGYVKERLGMTLDRLGKEALEAALATDDLLLRKEEILAKPLLEKQ